MAIFGIDVSHWQGNFNFQAAKNEGVKYAILKAGGGDDGLYQDSKFNTYYSNAKAVGMGVGAYFFGNAYSVAQAQKEADKFISILKGKQFDYPVYYDVEGNMLNQSYKSLTDVVYAFCDRVEKAGFFVGIYSGQWVFDGKLDDKKLSRYAHWLAYWSKNKPTLKYSGDPGLWQFGGETNYIRSNKIAGVVCDQDYCYIDYPEAIKRLGLNGYKADDHMDTWDGDMQPIEPEKPKKTVDQLAQEVIDGKWSIGAERKKLLEAAGYNYNEVQERVNQMLSKTQNQPTPEYYTVKSGDTMTGIAKKKGTTLAKLAVLNPSIKNLNKIFPGQKIRVK